jgi:hypothetical protein
MKRAWMLIMVLCVGCGSYQRVAVDVQIDSRITPVIPVHVSCKIELEKAVHREE